MIFLLIATNLITLALLLAAVATSRRDVRAERDRAAEREDSLLNRIQAPQQAVVQSMTEQAGPLAPAHISAFDDVALAEYEENIHKLELSTRQLVEQYDGSADPEPVQA